MAKETSLPVTDTHNDTAIATVLRMLVAIAVLLTIAGGGLYLAQYGSALASYATFLGPANHTATVRGVFAGAMALQSESIIQLGVLCLIATPIVRVALSLLGFARQRDWMYTVITAIVLLILLVGVSGVH